MKRRPLSLAWAPMGAAAPRMLNCLQWRARPSGGPELVVNRKTASALGVTLLHELILRADEVIQ